MKQKIFSILALLCLAVSGAWAQDPTITVYFTDAKGWGDVKVYYWPNGTTWPGDAMTYVKDNEYSQKIYRAEIPATAVGIIFNGNGNQTVDITENIADGSWWYTTDQLDGWKNKVGYVGKYTENIDVTNVDDNKWTFTMPDCNVELDIEYYPAYPVTIDDAGVDAANWSATPTEQSAGQTVTLQYTGKKKIRSITIEKAAPATVPVTAITLNKTATTISAGQTETLSVSSVTPDDATDQTVTWSSDNEAVATVNATTGEVTAVAFGTANITATANDGSGVTATCAVTVSKVVTINQSDWGESGNSFTKDGVTVSATMIDRDNFMLFNGGTFSTALGNFTKIVVTAGDTGYNTGWNDGTWTGTPASTVSFDEIFGFVTTIVCTIVPKN